MKKPAPSTACKLWQGVAGASIVILCLYSPHRGGLLVTGGVIAAVVTWKVNNDKALMMACSRLTHRQRCDRWCTKLVPVAVVKIIC